MNEPPCRSEDAQAEAPTGSTPEAPRFAVVRAQRDGARHVLAPGAEGGTALCGVEPTAAGWYLVGYAARLLLIPCPLCRERAAELLANLGGDAR